MEEAAGDATIDKARGPRGPRRAGRPPPRARPKHLRRAEGAAPVQPQRLLGSRRAPPAHRPRVAAANPAKLAERSRMAVRAVNRNFSQFVGASADDSHPHSETVQLKRDGLNLKQTLAELDREIRQSRHLLD